MKRIVLGVALASLCSARLRAGELLKGPPQKTRAYPVAVRLNPVAKWGRVRAGCLAAFERVGWRRSLSNGRNASGSWAVKETLNAWYEPKDHSIAICCELRSPVDGHVQV